MTSSPRIWLDIYIIVTFDWCSDCDSFDLMCLRNCLHILSVSLLLFLYAYLTSYKSHPPMFAGLCVPMCVCMYVCMNGYIRQRHKALCVLKLYIELTVIKCWRVIVAHISETWALKLINISLFLFVWTLSTCSCQKTRYFSAQNTKPRLGQIPHNDINPENSTVYSLPTLSLYWSNFSLNVVNKKDSN